MNTVKINNKLSRQSVEVDTLIGQNYKPSKTAFIGSFSKDGPLRLFLICYSCVVDADEPSRTWNSGFVFIDRLIDVVITEVEGK